MGPGPFRRSAARLSMLVFIELLLLRDQHFLLYTAARAAWPPGPTGPPRLVLWYGAYFLFGEGLVRPTTSSSVSTRGSTAAGASTRAGVPYVLKLLFKAHLRELSKCACSAFHAAPRSGASLSL